MICEGRLTGNRKEVVGVLQLSGQVGGFFAREAVDGIAAGLGLPLFGGWCFPCEFKYGGVCAVIGQAGYGRWLAGFFPGHDWYNGGMGVVIGFQGIGKSFDLTG